MEHNNKFSPLFKTRNILKISRYLLGFPLRSNSDCFTTFTFRPYFEWTKFVIVLITLFATAAPLGVVLFNVRNNATEYTEAAEYYFKSGSSAFDFTIILLCSPIIMISLVCHFLSFKNIPHHLSNICQTIDRTRHGMLDFQVSKKNQTNSRMCIYDDASKNMVYGHMLNLLGAASKTYGLYLLLFGCYFPNFFTTEKSALIIISNAVFMIMSGYPLISSTAEFIVITIINDIANNFEMWSLEVHECFSFNKWTNGPDIDDMQLHTTLKGKYR